jgi:dihydrolipoamide dehydrogenase
MLAHKATHQARVAAAAAAGRKAAFEPASIPAVVFTDPEIAWCGLTEEQARRDGVEVAVSRFPWAASGRAATLGRSEGLTKLVIDPRTERVRGVGIVGSGAGELIGEGTLAVEMAAVASDLGLTVHAHPTLSETLMEAADAYYGQSTHLLRAKRG